MSKTRKTLVIAFLIIGSAFILISFLPKSGVWSNNVYCVLALGGFLLATIALVLVMFRRKV